MIAKSMNLLFSVLFVILISSSRGQDLSSTTVDTSSSLQTSSGVGGGAEAQAFRDRFTESPELPGLPSNGTNSSDPDIGSSIGSSSVGFGSSIDNTPDSRSSNDDQVHSVGSDDEDNSAENDPTTSNGLNSSDSGSVIFSNDDTSASSNLDAASDASSTPLIAFCMAYSLAMIATTTIFLV